MNKPDDVLGLWHGLCVERHRKTCGLYKAEAWSLHCAQESQRKTEVRISTLQGWEGGKDTLVPSMYRTVLTKIHFGLWIKLPMTVTWAKQKFVSLWFKTWEGENSELCGGSAPQNKSLTSKALGIQALPCSPALHGLHAQRHIIVTDGSSWSSHHPSIPTRKGE